VADRRLVIDQTLQGFGAEDAHVALLDFDHAFFHKFRESPADGLQLEAQVAADFFASHAQHQFGLRKAACVQALHQVEQKRPPGALRPACCPGAASRHARARSLGS